MRPSRSFACFQRSAHTASCTASLAATSSSLMAWTLSPTAARRSGRRGSATGSCCARRRPPRLAGSPCPSTMRCAHCEGTMLPFECSVLPFFVDTAARGACYCDGDWLGTRTRKRGDRRRRCTRGRSMAAVGMAANPSRAHQAGRHRAGHILAPACREVRRRGCEVGRRTPSLWRCSLRTAVTEPAASPPPPTALQLPDRTSRRRCFAPSPAPCCSTTPPRRVR